MLCNIISPTHHHQAPTIHWQIHHSPIPITLTCSNTGTQTHGVSNLIIAFNSNIHNNEIYDNHETSDQGRDIVAEIR